MPNLDLTKPIQTRDGRMFKLFFVTGDTIFGHVITGDIASDYGWYRSGRFNHMHDHPLDLINVPEASDG